MRFRRTFLVPSLVLALVTTLGAKGPGAPVNIEVDVMAKHVEKLLAGHLPSAAP